MVEFFRHVTPVARGELGGNTLKAPVVTPGLLPPTKNWETVLGFAGAGIRTEPRIVEDEDEFASAMRAGNIAARNP